MALATSEVFQYGQEVDPRKLQVGQRAIAVEVFFRHGIPCTGPSVGQREIVGTVKAIPAADSEAGFVHLQPDPEDDQSSAPIHVLNIARAAAYYGREQVESSVYFYTPDNIAS